MPTNHVIVLNPGDTLAASAPLVPIPAPNQPPMVNVGLDKQIKLPISEVQLNSVVSDSDGTIVSYKWEKVSGGNANILTPLAKDTKVTGLVAGDYMFRLTATDDKGGKTADDLTVKVLPADIVIPPDGRPDYLKMPTVTKPVFESDKTYYRQKFVNPGAVIANLAGKRNIKFVECFFEGQGTSPFEWEAISIENTIGVLVDKCLFHRIACAVYGLNSAQIRVINSQCVNVGQRPIKGARGQFVQFNSCYGEGIAVEDNKIENFAGESNPEDIISCYRTNGTQVSPVSIRRNMIRGGGPSPSGGGIMTGDYGGSWQVVDGNTLLDPGQYGIACAGGYNIQLINNKIYAKQQPFTNNPLYVWAQQGAAMGNITVKGNRVNWTDKSGNKNGGWNAGNGTNISFEYPGTISLAEMGVPDHLIDMLTPAELLTLRGK